MEVQNDNQIKSGSIILKKILVPLILIIIIVVIAGIYIFNKNKTADEAQFINDDSSQIERSSIPGSIEFEKGDISFSYPSDYKFNELEKDYYVVFKEGESIPSEAGINIDARRQGVKNNYEQALKAARNNLNSPMEKEIPGGVKMYGTIKEGVGAGIPTLYVYLKYGQGALVVEHSGEILNEAVFDQVVNSIKIN